MAGMRAQKQLAPGARIRVLVVDDSVVVRRLVAQALASDQDVEVVGTAPDGTQALTRIPQLNPDLLTLDIEMPGLDGLETLRRVRRHCSDLRVIMCSTLTERGASATFEALALGADDYVTKVANGASLANSVARLRDELLPKVKQFFHLNRQPPPPAAVPARATRRAPAPTAMALPPKAVVIGCSTGGPAALGGILPQFPADFPLPVLIVQHMPPLFTRLLAERLSAGCRLRVEEAAEGAAVEPGKVLLAPGDYHMRLTSSAGAVLVRLDQGPPENSCRPAVDVLFRSAADLYGGSVVAAVLTGMGQDGTRGAQTLKALGATLLAQDEDSSVVWGMPGSVVRAGLADAVLPLPGVVPEILRLAGCS